MKPQEGKVFHSGYFANQRMEIQQELEWVEAQKIVINEDLVAAAKQQLQFLAAVDRNRHLYDGSALDSAIYRYKYCWFPLLAKHVESQFPEGPLVVPLDCEWIWHCHRLNPARYKTDCEELYGRILDSQNVVSSVHGTSKKQTEEIWKMMYPNEPYELNLSDQREKPAETKLGALRSTSYDLFSAVKRQSPFYYQVSRSSMNDDLFLEGAAERYKGFLHLIRTNMERKMKHFCVPTYDIDLIWHSHQLNPVSYCKDLVAILGEVLEHDDRDSDRTEGEKLEIGFCRTTKQWEETFGSRYWRAGAMYRGSVPLPLTINSLPLKTVSKKVRPSLEYQNVVQLRKTLVVEVMLEIVSIKNLPDSHTSSLSISFCKKHSDLIFNTKKTLSIPSEPAKKQVAVFLCEPTGELLFELVSNSSSNLYMATSPDLLGTTSIFLQDLLNPLSKLPIEKWFQLVPSYANENAGSQPISLRLAVSVTAPFPAPYVLHMVQAHHSSRNCSFFPLPERVQQAKSWTCIVDEAGNEVISIQMRDPEGRNGCNSEKEVIGMTRSGETCVLAELVGEGWSFMGFEWFLHLQKKITEEDNVFELTGSRKSTIFQGRKLGYEVENSERKKNEQDFMTIVEFSDENPYGKAVALFNFKFGFLKVEEQWFVLPGITLAVILFDILKKEGCDCFNATLEGDASQVEKMAREYGGCFHETIVKSHCFSNWLEAGACGGSGGCGGGCGGGGGGCRGGGCSGGGGCGGGRCRN